MTERTFTEDEIRVAVTKAYKDRLNVRKARMTKYRIVKAFPDGYHIEKRGFLWIWRPIVLERDTGFPFRYPTVLDAKKAVSQLQEHGREAWRSE